MKFIKLKTILFVFYLINFTIAQAYSNNPKDFIQELVNDAISNLADKSIQQDEKIKFIENLAINNVDIKALGLYTLGKFNR